MSGRLVRAVAPEGPSVRIFIDGAEVSAWPGDSVLVAVLTARSALRSHEFNDEPRAGFCLMGACQDCWVWLADHARVRAARRIAFVEATRSRSNPINRLTNETQSVISRAASSAALPPET